MEIYLNEKGRAGESVNGELGKSTYIENLRKRRTSVAYG